MKFSSLKMINFMPFYGEHIISFDQPDTSRNVTIIYGDNMRGKTSILNAFRWVLYGKALSRNLTVRPYSEIINYNASARGDYRSFCQLDFFSENKKYSLTREVVSKSTTQKPLTNSDYEEHVFLSVDGDVVARDQIEREINLLVPEQVSRFFLFDGELLSEYELLLEERHDKGELIKESIEKVLGVPSLVNGKMDLEFLERDFRQKHHNELKATKHLEAIADEEGKIIEKDRLNSINESELRHRIQDYEAQAKKLNDEIDEINRAIEVQATLKAKESDLKETHLRLDEVERSLRTSFSSSWRDLLRPLAEAQVAKLQVEYDALIGDLKAVGVIEGNLSRLKMLLDQAHCPTCNQEVTITTKEHVRRELDSLLHTSVTQANHQELITTLGHNLSILNKILARSVRQLIDEKTSEKHSLNRRIVKYQNEIETLKDQLERLQPQEAMRKKKDLEFCQREIGQAKASLHQLDVEKQKLRSALVDIRETIKKSPSRNSSRASLAYDLASRLQDIFESSIERLRIQLKEQVAENATLAFKEMTTQDSYESLRINSNYGLTIIDSDGNEVRSRSAGAEQVVALSLIDGLSATGRKQGPIVMDTPFGRLDPSHRANVLAYLSKRASQLILLVHEGEIRKEGIDLEVINRRISRRYEIREVSSTSSEIARI